MAPQSTSTPAKSGMLSLYANLLDPSADSSSPGTISRAPVVFKQAAEIQPQQDDQSAKKQQISAAALRFQPTKRPQLAAQKPKPKPTVPKAAVSASSSPAGTPAPGQGNAPTRAPPKTTLADWAITGDDDDVNGFYGGEKRQRGGRKKRKKNREAEMIMQDWDDVYDPSRPNNYEEYKHSEEKIREIREWKQRLYSHRIARQRSSDFDSDEDDYRPQMNRQFAPPSNLNFAPPPDLQAGSPERSIPEAPAMVPDDPTGEDAFARRLRMSQSQFQNPPEAIPPPPKSNPPPAIAQPEPPQYSASISRAPVRYSLPPAPEEIPASEMELEAAFSQEKSPDAEPSEDAPRSLRPGQKGFAERLLAKYGWKKGSGLGASGSGIVNPLQVKLEKQKKKPDSEGGGFVGPGGRGKIVGGRKKKADDEGKFGAMSEVVVCYGMLDGLDLDAEMETGQDGGLIQEIGEECAEKYGRVERVFVNRNSTGSVPVFIKFTTQLSGLRAVNALEGRIFNGNAITARFFNTEKFEKGIYEE